MPQQEFAIKKTLQDFILLTISNLASFGDTKQRWSQHPRGVSGLEAGEISDIAVWANLWDRSSELLKSTKTALRTNCSVVGFSQMLKICWRSKQKNLCPEEGPTQKLSNWSSNYDFGQVGMPENYKPPTEIEHWKGLPTFDTLITHFWHWASMPLSSLFFHSPRWIVWCFRWPSPCPFQHGQNVGEIWGSFGRVCHNHLKQP